MSDTSLLYLLLIAVAAFVVGGRALFYVIATYRKSHLYKLYSVRDRFIQLVAQGELKEDGVIFQTFYGAINATLRQGKRYNVRLVISTIARISQEIAKDDVDRLKKLRREFDSARPHVKQAVGEYFMATIELLLANSLTLKLIVKCLSPLVALNRICRLPKTASYNAYSATSDFQKALDVA